LLYITRIIELSTLKASERWEKTAPLFYTAISDNINAEEIASLPQFLTDNQLWKSWLSSGYPEPVLQLKRDVSSIWIENYSNTYINRDVRGLFPHLNIGAFRRLVSMLASLSGIIINFAELPRSLSVSQPTVRDYIEILHRTFIWRKLPAYIKNITKRVTKMPRGHVRDSGLVHHFLHIDDTEKLISHSNVGRLWESFVTEEILKGMQNAIIPHESYYYRTSNGAEIDLILEGNFGLLPIEIKLGTRIDHRSLTALKDFISDNKLQLGIVVNNNLTTEWLHEKILQIPATVI
jgi:predicted AAA+ superfamily ATPase